MQLEVLRAGQVARLASKRYRVADLTAIEPVDPANFPAQQCKLCSELGVRIFCAVALFCGGIYTEDGLILEGRRGCW